VNAAVIAAFLVAPRPPDVTPTRTELRAETEMGKPADEPATPRPPTPSVAAIEEPVRSGRPPDVPTLTAPPPVPLPQITPGAVQPVAPPASFAPGPSPADETLRQRRRRERSELPAVQVQPPAATPVLPSHELQLKIDLLVWAAEPRERMVYVNGHKYVEGQTLENGVVLEHIEQDGIVVIQEGRRLRLKSEGH
jgi:hypothetical protein